MMTLDTVHMKNLCYMTYVRFFVWTVSNIIKIIRIEKVFYYLTALELCLHCFQKLLGHAPKIVLQAVKR